MNQEQYAADKNNSRRGQHSGPQKHADTDFQALIAEPSRSLLTTDLRQLQPPGNAVVDHFDAERDDHCREHKTQRTHSRAHQNSRAE